MALGLLVFGLVGREHTLSSRGRCWYGTRSGGYPLLWVFCFRSGGRGHEGGVVGPWGRSDSDHRGGHQAAGSQAS